MRETVTAVVTILLCVGIHAGEASKEGKVFIKSDPPGAAIFLLARDGEQVSQKDLGKKAAALVIIPEGRQTLVLKLDGYEDATLVVNADSVAISKPETVTLERKTVALDVLFGEDGWFVCDKDRKQLLDARQKPATAPCTVKLPLGVQELLLVKEGFADIRQKVEIKGAGQTVAITAKPAKAAGTQVAKPPTLAAPKPTQAEIESFTRERKELLDKAKTETDRARKGALLADAARLGLKVGDATAMAELDKIVRDFLNVDYNNAPGRAVIAKAEFLAAQGNWKEAENTYASVWKRYRGAYGELGCNAANAVAKHYEDASQIDAAAPFKDAVVECGGPYGDLAADACFWLCDYYLKKADKVRAESYLRKVVEKYPGAFEKKKEAAEAKLQQLAKK